MAEEGSTDKAQGATYLAQWDASVKRFGGFFDMLKTTNRDDIFRIRTNLFSSWKDQTRLQYWYDRTETIALRRQLGEISSEEVSELNRVIGADGTHIVSFSLSNKEPALV